LRIILAMELRSMTSTRTPAAFRAAAVCSSNSSSSSRRGKQQQSQLHQCMTTEGLSGFPLQNLALTQPQGVTSTIYNDNNTNDEEGKWAHVCKRKAMLFSNASLHSHRSAPPTSMT
jgi:hypothetical protein